MMGLPFSRIYGPTHFGSSRAGRPFRARHAGRRQSRFKVQGLWGGGFRLQQSLRCWSNWTSTHAAPLPVTNSNPHLPRKQTPDGRPLAAVSRDLPIKAGTAHPLPQWRLRPAELSNPVKLSTVDVSASLLARPDWVVQPIEIAGLAVAPTKLQGIPFVTIGTACFGVLLPIAFGRAIDAWAKTGG